jgi:hypothetical protein
MTNSCRRTCAGVLPPGAGSGAWFRKYRYVSSWSSGVAGSIGSSCGAITPTGSGFGSFRGVRGAVRFTFTGALVATTGLAAAGLRTAGLRAVGRAGADLRAAVFRAAGLRAAGLLAAGLSGAGAGRLVADAEAAGLVVRVRDSAFLRASFAALTAARATFSCCLMTLTWCLAALTRDRASRTAAEETETDFARLVAAGDFFFMGFSVWSTPRRECHRFACQRHVSAPRPVLRAKKTPLVSGVVQFQRSPEINQQNRVLYTRNGHQKLRRLVRWPFTRSGRFSGPGGNSPDLHTATALQMELSQTVPTLIAWVSFCIFSPTKD